MSVLTLREKRILAVAHYFLYGFGGDADPSPSDVRNTYLRAVGWESLAGAEIKTDAELHLDDNSAVTLTLRIRDRRTLNAVAKIVRLPFVVRLQDGVLRIHGGGKVESDTESWEALAQARLAEPKSRHIRKDRLDGRRVATVLAVHYLSKAGNGTRTDESAIELLTNHIEDPAVLEHTEGWPSSRDRILRTLRTRYGPLVSEST